MSKKSKKSVHSTRVDQNYALELARLIVASNNVAIVWHLPVADRDQVLDQLVGIALGMNRDDANTAAHIVCYILNETFQPEIRVLSHVVVADA